jgi:uncharacterized protein (TIGR02118 family)
MIKSISFITRNPELTPEEFRTYWVDVHAPLVKSRLPGLKQYMGYLPIPGTDLTHWRGSDAIVQLGFESMEAMYANVNRPEFRSADRDNSSAHLMVMSRIQRVVAEEIDFM